MEGLRLLVVRPYTLEDLAAGRAPDDSPSAVVAADVLGAGPGEDVVVSYGHAARVALEELAGSDLPSHPIDAAIVAIVDRCAFHEGSLSTGGED